jgi:hypothetical protein
MRDLHNKMGKALGSKRCDSGSGTGSMRPTITRVCRFPSPYFLQIFGNVIPLEMLCKS